MKLFVGVKEDKTKFLEPTPVCYTGNIGNDDSFEIAFIGLNPYQDNDNLPYNTFDTKDTTWKKLSDYHCPKDELSMVTDSVYRHIAENALAQGKYYDFVFRVHQACLNKDIPVFDSWNEMRKWVNASSQKEWGEELGVNLEDSIPKKDNNKQADEIIKQFFLKEFWAHPTLCAEMIPYKSKSYALSSDTTQNFLNFKEYKDYLEELIIFLGNHTNSDSYIFFFGHTDSVINFLATTKCVERLDIWPEEATKKKSGQSVPSIHKFVELYKHPIGRTQKNDTKTNNFYFFKWGGRKIIIAPFLSYHGVQIMLKGNKLIERIKNGELFIPNSEKNK